MKVIDIIENNDPETIVKIQGCNSQDDCDGFVEEYFHGKLSVVPEHLKNHTVVRTGYLMGAICYGIYIPYLKKSIASKKIFNAVSCV